MARKSHCLARWDLNVDIEQRAFCRCCRPQRGATFADAVVAADLVWGGGCAWGRRFERVQAKHSWEANWMATSSVTFRLQVRPPHPLAAPSAALSHQTDLAHTRAHHAPLPVLVPGYLFSNGSC